MAVSANEARRLALALAGVTEAPHFDRAAFRTPRKIFATLGSSGEDLNLMFDPEHQQLYCSQAPKMFAPVPGGWGRMGATRVDLKAADAKSLAGALAAAHALAAPKPKAVKKAAAKK